MKNFTFRKELVEAQDELLRFAYKLTMDIDEANDLLQETSLKALYNEDKYISDTNFRGWMYTIMRNLPQDAGFESTENAYDLKEMHRVVNALAKEYKIPFAMHLAGFKYREIADKLHLPLGTVKSRIFFIRKKLQEELKDFR